MSKKTLSPKKFTFEISLSVLNHLGRNLYRSFSTVLGEAISNSWDADANNVWIFVDKNKNSLLVKDDGEGMTEEDFQNKFLKIGYSKRKDGSVTSSKNRPYIGRKGIGKLALLSCADKITVISKTGNTDYVGGVIDNSDLSQAITNDLNPDQYQLGIWQENTFDRYLKNHRKGTIIYFENIKDGIKGNLDVLKKTIALYFRFSLLDDSFNIHLNGEKIVQDHLSSLSEETEFLWKINKINDPYIENQLSNVKESASYEIDVNAKGFIASVGKPSHLKVISTEEKAGIDLFVNGRLREKNILKHMPEFSTRHVASYLYGQIHFDELDGDENDRFTTSRESVVAGDPKYEQLLKTLKENLLERISNDWDKWRRKNRQEGDPENESITPKERKAEELFNVVAKEYDLPKKSENRELVDGWVGRLLDDAKYNFTSYAECFISENLVRMYIKDKGIALSDEAKRDIEEFKKRETQNKGNGNISIDLRQVDIDLSYLDMAGLANLVDKTGVQNSLPSDAKQYRPIRDALMHTALLTDEAKRKLTTIYDNIKGRIKTLLSTNSTPMGF